MNGVSQWIKDRRKELNLTQAQVAAKVGVNQANISTWENGKVEPTKTEMLKLNEVFGAFSISVKENEPDQHLTPAPLPQPSVSDPSKFHIQINSDTYITADRLQYILRVGNHKYHFTHLNGLLKYMIESEIKRSPIAGIDELINRLNEINHNIDEKFRDYDLLGIRK